MADKNDPINKRKNETLLQRLNRQARQADIKLRTKESQNWFRKKVRTLGKQPTFDTLQRENREVSRMPRAGYMYTFHYQAKHDETLPYWDRFPLIFVIDQYTDGFLGLNVHYLPPKARAVIFDQLLSVSNKPGLSPGARLRISWEVIKSFARFPLFQPMVKRYLSRQIRSKVVRIPSTEWEPAIYLPTENFKGAVNTKVWSDSMSGRKPPRRKKRG